MLDADPEEKALQLSQEEAFALLDLCVLHHGDLDGTTNGAILKLCKFIRQNMARSLEEEAVLPLEATLPADAPPASSPTQDASE